MEIKKIEGLWELNGKTNEIPVSEDNLLYWALDMYKRGFEFDSELDAYGASVDYDHQKFPKIEDKDNDYFFKQGLTFYRQQNLSSALFWFTFAIDKDPKDVDSYYSRAIIKNELYTWKSALKDYNKAIEIAPKFAAALINRGSIKDENGDFEGAIADYNSALSINNLDIEQKRNALFNRGNTKFNLRNNKEACEDWNLALQAGAEYAQERIDMHCGK